MQVPQEAAVAQGSGGGAQDEGTQSQSAPEQEPSVGPPKVPGRQAPAVAHQPQPAVPVHDEQLPKVQVGGGGVQVPKAQSEAQAPPVGPPAAPSTQVLVAPHQPQPDAETQEPQLVPVQVGGGVQVPKAQPDAQVPPVGPRAAPSRQVPLAPHQPQPDVETQDPQLVPVQVLTGRRHRPASQLSPELQVVPQHTSPSCPQVASERQTPAMQLYGGMQAVEPEQHAWPRLPQEGTRQNPPVHVVPGSHSGVVTQHISSRPPQAVHEPPTQARLASQVSNSQQAAPSAPHPPVVAVQVPDAQIRPPQHSEPVQLAPVGAQQKPPVHGRPSQHSLSMLQ